MQKKSVIYSSIDSICLLFLVQNIVKIPPQKSAKNVNTYDNIYKSPNSRDSPPYGPSNGPEGGTGDRRLRPG